MPPLIDGVGDFAAGLARELKDNLGYRSQFLCADPAQEFSSNAPCSPCKNSAVEPGDIRILRNRSAAALAVELGAVRCDQVLLHYSGYGFDSRGAPLWLSSGLSRFSATSEVPIATFFHELWSSGPFWKRAFYLHPLQQWIVKQIARRSNAVLTSNSYMARLLGGNRNVVTAPIPASIPEPEADSPGKSDGMLRLVVFGQEHTRERTLKTHRQLLEQLARRGAILLLLAGKNAGCASEKTLVPSSVPFLCIANPAVEQIQGIFSRAGAALSYYPAHLAAKSASIMTALACGCPVVVPQPRLNGEVPNLIFSNGSAECAERIFSEWESRELRRRGERARRWYSENASWPVAARRISIALGLTREPALV